MRAGKENGVEKAGSAGAEGKRGVEQLLKQDSCSSRIGKECIRKSKEGQHQNTSA